MASKDEQIPFTVGDQENIRVTKVLVEQMHSKLDKLDDLDVHDTRISSLETSRKRIIGAAVTILVTVLGGLALWGLKGLIAGAVVAGAAGAILP